MDIVNITAVLSFGKRIEFPASTKYNPKRFPGGIYKNFGATLLLFKTGKIVVVGVRDFGHLNSILPEIGEKFGQVLKTDVKNIVGSYDFQHRIDLGQILNDFSCKHVVIYEPELFAGLRFYHNNALTTIFHTGKIYITGAKTVDHLNQTFCQVQRFMEHRDES